MYQTNTLVAPCDGVISGVDKENAQLLSTNGSGYTLSFLANSPNGDNETLYFNYVGKVAAVATNGWLLNVNPQAYPIADYLDLSGVPLDEVQMTQAVLHTQTEIPVFTLTEGAWVSVDRTTIGSGDILLFAANAEGNLIWSVLVQKAAVQPENPAGSKDPVQSTTPTVPENNTNSTMPSIPGGFSGFPSGDTMQQEPEFELYSLQMVDVAAVTPQDTLTLDITIDELDVRALQVGMTAQVKINALGGEKHQATITEIGNTGANNGGNSKYTVELTMDRTENMLSGMNATATIVLSTENDISVILAAALVEKGTQTVVYTGYDEKTEELTNPVTVKTGGSDGETVEILDGLSNGQTYYYAYYDTLEISYTPDFGGGLFGR